MNALTIRFKKLTPSAQTPTQAKRGDAGYDLYATESVTIKPFQRAVVKTGIAIEIPEGYYGRIAPRSGLAVKAGIDVLAGVVDAGYRNEVGVVLINLNVLDWLYLIVTNPVEAFASLFGTSGEFKIKQGDKVAQIIIEKCHSISWIESTELTDSERGQDGFGSTDKK
jgi:dUTP pyrophosphatase